MLCVYVLFTPLYNLESPTVETLPDRMARAFSLPHSPFPECTVPSPPLFGIILLSENVSLQSLEFSSPTGLTKCSHFPHLLFKLYSGFCPPDRPRHCPHPV